MANSCYFWKLAAASALYLIGMPTPAAAERASLEAKAPDHTLFRSRHRLGADGVPSAILRSSCRWKGAPPWQR